MEMAAKEFVEMMVSDEDSNKQRISTLVFMDLEATGLPSFVGKKNVHITEISLVAVDRTDFEADSSLRVLNKLSLCVRPRTAISPGAMSITGLYNDVLENQEQFDESIPKLLEFFFRRLRRPLCLLAHNGKRYDFPLLQAELNNISYMLDSEILCADTLEAFRSINSNPTKTQIHWPLRENTVLETPKKPCNDAAVKQDNASMLDDETDKLLSEDMDIFVGLKEPDITDNSCKINKLNPANDEHTPPKAKQDCGPAQMPNKHKRVKQDVDGPMENTVTPHAKRQLFVNGTSSERSNTNFNITPSKPVRFTLEKLYYHYFGEEPPKSHYAEADCITLSKICQRISKEFLGWIDENSMPFCETKAMW